MTLTALELKLWHKTWFPDFDGGHFENGPKQVVHPNFFWWHRLLISGEVQGAKKTWSQTVLGGGVHGNPIWPMDYHWWHSDHQWVVFAWRSQEATDLSQKTISQQTREGWTNVGLIYVQRLRRRANINLTLVQHLVFAGFLSKLVTFNRSTAKFLATSPHEITEFSEGVSRYLVFSARFVLIQQNPRPWWNNDNWWGCALLGSALASH